MIPSSPSVALGTKPLKKRAKRRRGKRPRTGAKTRIKSGHGTPKRSCSGAEIRAKIAANRAKRLAIAEAMKREAGVMGHEINRENLAGLAYIGTGRILSPEGRKIVQLYTLAHECGHIFLHNSGPGYWYPGHLKELEAESYAHQAFREHGMTLPRRLSDWGRTYVGSWIAKDRAANIPIDPRAIAYAAGQRSPFAPLRLVPPTWRTFRAEGATAFPAPHSVALKEASWPVRALARLHGSRLANEARAVLRLAGWSLLYGYFASSFGAAKLTSLYPEVFPKAPYDAHLSGPALLVAVAGGLVIANLAVLWRTVTR